MTSDALFAGNGADIRLVLDVSKCTFPVFEKRSISQQIEEMKACFRCTRQSIADGCMALLGE